MDYDESLFDILLTLSNLQEEIGGITESFLLKKEVTQNSEKHQWMHILISDGNGKHVSRADFLSLVRSVCNQRL